MSESKSTELRLAVKALRPYLRQAFGFSLVITVLALAPIGYMREVYGPVMDARSENTLAWVTLVLLVALVLSGVVEWTRSRVMMAASVKFAERIAPRVFDATFRAHMHRLQGARQALSDLRVVRNFMVSPSMYALMDAPLGFVFLVLVFLVHPLMGLMSLLGALIVFVVGWLAERKVRPLVQEAQRYSNMAQAFAADSGRNSQVIEAMGMREAIRTRWREWQDRFLSNQALASAAQARGAATSKFVMLAQGSLLLGIGVLLTITGVLPPSAAGGIIIAKILGARAMAPVMTLINSWKQVDAARDAFERLENFLQRLPEREQRMAMPPPQGHLAVEGAAVRAPGTKQTILSDVNFVLKAGRTLAVVGPSGSGKSSLARMIIGLWAPLVGTVRLDGVDVTSWDKAQLGPHLGYLPQDVELFDGTLAENIARFGDIDRDKLDDAIRLAGLGTLIEQLPQGVDTDIGDDGATLSGGQRQRVGLARALYGSPRLVVLDEPNSSLDEAGDADLLSALRQMKQRGCTVVVITHRTGLLSVVDQMLVMAEGRPRLYGPRDQVLAKLMGRQPEAPVPAEPQAAAAPPAPAAVAMAEAAEEAAVEEAAAQGPAKAA